MRRRDLLATAGAALLPAPSIAQDTRTKTLRFAPESNLAVLDPIQNGGTSSQDHAAAVYDTLYGVDKDMVPKPQMAAGHTISDDGRTWLFPLREDLRFHDGQPVRGADCAASMARWAKRDPFGILMSPFVEAWDAPDDRTMRVRLTKPFPQLLNAIAHPSVAYPVIMPEGVAATGANVAVTSRIGSGPYRFKADEFLSGSRVVYEKFAGYVPRSEPADYTSGGKVVHFDRLEWQVIPDVATGTAALQNGEIDWLEVASSDMLPTIENNPGIKFQVQDPGGRMSFLRFNTAQPPFDNPAIRRAVLGAVSQSDYMDASNGGRADLSRSCYSMFPCGAPMVQQVGRDLMAPPRSLARSRDQLKAAGYNGEKVVVLSADDIGLIRDYAAITADLLGHIGMNVDLQSMDWGTLLQRRTSRAPVSSGGWSLFPCTWSGVVIGTPPSNFMVRGIGPAGYAGDFTDPAIEHLTTTYMESGSGADQQTLLNEIQQRAFEQAPSVPLGQWFRKTAFRSDITGIIPAWISLPWNVRRI